jgi:hypothetical protein
VSVSSAVRLGRPSTSRSSHAAYRVRYHLHGEGVPRRPFARLVSEASGEVRSIFAIGKRTQDATNAGEITAPLTARAPATHVSAQESHGAESRAASRPVFCPASRRQRRSAQVDAIAADAAVAHRHVVNDFHRASFRAASVRNGQTRASTRKQKTENGRCRSAHASVMRANCTHTQTSQDHEDHEEDPRAALGVSAGLSLPEGKNTERSTTSLQQFYSCLRCAEGKILEFGWKSSGSFLHALPSCAP